MEINRQLNPVSNGSSITKELVNVSTNNISKKTEADKATVDTVAVGVSPTEFAKNDKVEISSKEMQMKSKHHESMKLQDKAVKESTKKDTLSKLVEQGKGLMELASKHESANADDKKAIESEAKDILKDMKKTIENMTGKVKSEAPDKELDSIASKDVEKLDMKEFLKKDTIEKEIVKPLKEASKKTEVKLNDMTEKLTSSQVGSLTQSEAQASMENVKDKLKSVDLKSLSSKLDERRQNVSHLLR